MPREGASETSVPDHVHGFTPRCAAEANDARHTADFPSAPLQSEVGCDSSRKGCASRAHPRAEMNIFWKALRPVRYSGGLGCGFSAGFAGSELQPANIAKQNTASSSFFIATPSFLNEFIEP